MNIISAKNVIRAKAVPLHTTKALGGREGIPPTHSRPRTALSGQPHAPAALSPGERTPGTHWIGRWVGPRAGLDTRDYRKILLPLPVIELRSPGCPARSQTLY
jgi:hypothetical protein